MPASDPVLMNNTNWEASSLQDLLHMPYVIPLPGANATAQDMVEALGQPCGAPPPLSYVLCLKDNHAKRVLSSLLFSWDSPIP